jgi:hypothetical protein
MQQPVPSHVNTPPYVVTVTAAYQRILIHLSLATKTFITILEFQKNFPHPLVPLLVICVIFYEALYNISVTLNTIPYNTWLQRKIYHSVELYTNSQ